MAQWFKRVWVRLFGSAVEKQIDFNRKRVCTEMENLSGHLYDCRKENSWKIIREVIDMAKNVQILDGTKCKTTDQQLVSFGRLQALSDIGEYIDRAIESKMREAETKEKQKVRGQVRAAPIRQPSNQAGLAI